MGTSNWHICSLIIQYHHSFAQSVKEEISAIPEAEVVTQNNAEQTYVVVMESEDHDLLYQKIQSLHDISGVLAVSLVYHQQEESTEDVK